MEPQVGKNRIIAEFRASPRGLRWPPHHEPGQVPFWVVLPTKVCGRTQGKIAGPGSLQDSQVLSILNLELYSAVPNALVTQILGKPLVRPVRPEKILPLRSGITSPVAW